MTRLQVSIYLAILFLVGCDESTTTIDARCEIEVVQPEEDVARGTNIVLEAYPLGTIIDTTVLINAEDIPVVDVNTSTDSCEECSVCRELHSCTTCGFCANCALDCVNCLHEVELGIPIDLQEAPEYLLTIVNGFGSSSPTAIEILDTNNNQ